MEGEVMPKKGVRVIVTGVQRRDITVEQMMQIVIALGRELAAQSAEPQAEVTSAAGSHP
jgi:hypothetical protein